MPDSSFAYSMRNDRLLCDAQHGVWSVLCQIILLSQKIQVDSDQCLLCACRKCRQAKDHMDAASAVYMTAGPEWQAEKE